MIFGTDSGNMEEDGYAVSATDSDERKAIPAV